MSDEEPKTGSGKPGPGRPLGALNRITKDLKEGLVLGLLSSDYAIDPTDPSGFSMAAYMRSVANLHPELFFQAIVKLIPKEVKNYLHNDTQIDVTFETIDQVKNAMLESGLSRQQIAMIENMLPMPLDEEAPRQ